MEVTLTTDFINNMVAVFLMAFADLPLQWRSPLYIRFLRINTSCGRCHDRLSATGEKAPVLAKLHAAKHSRNIPMMAGVVFVLVITFITLCFNLSRSQTWLPLAALLGGGLVGLIDDIVNVRDLGGGYKGLRPTLKFAMIAAVGLVGAWFFYYKLGTVVSICRLRRTILRLVGGLFRSLHLLLLQLAMLLILQMVWTVGWRPVSHGLYHFLVLLRFCKDNIGIAGFCFTVVGTLTAYTWFNIYPARFFMTDVGSFALGTALGVVAMLTNTLFLLPIIGWFLWSTRLQVSFRY